MWKSYKKTELKNWKFTIDQTGYGEGSGWASPTYDDSCWSDVESYTAWETYEYAMADYEGKGWFRTRYKPVQETGKRYILHFDGVGGTAQVFVNGKLVCMNANRYLPFEADMTFAMRKNGDNIIAVCVDNTSRGEKHLTGSNTVEWVLYGGLTRRVWIEERPLVFIDHVRVDAAADGTLKVAVTVEHRSTNIPYKGQLTARVEGLPECTMSSTVYAAPNPKAVLQVGRKTVITMECKADQPKLWSPDEPNLYEISVTMKGAGFEDSVVVDKFGFRTIEVQGTSILFNGEEIYIKGANRYDEFAPYGNCAPAEKIREDLLEMKKAGMNLVRTHYPQDPIHYEIADEIGIMYMIEVPLNWWYPAANRPFADFLGLGAEAVDCLDRTFYWHCNHPSWTIWSTGNECYHSHPACNQMFRLLADRMRGLNCGRLVTYAANKPLLDDKELDFCDIISMNYYSGIKSESVADFPEQLNEVLEEKMATAQRLYPNKPHMMSEYGYVCVRGIHGSSTEGRFTEDFGATFLKEKLRVFKSNPNMKGLVIWCWADYRHRRGFIGSPFGMHLNATYGPYGLVTMDRKPKEKLLKLLTDELTGWNPEE